LAFCPDDTFTCRWCSQSYCLNCGQNQACVTCQTALAGPLIQPAAVPQALGLKIHRYRWQQAENQAYIIYLGHHFWWGQAVIVTDRAGQVLHQQKTGWLSRFG
jgi:hypothetical protein